MGCCRQAISLMLPMARLCMMPVAVSCVTSRVKAKGMPVAIGWGTFAIYALFLDENY